MIYVEFCEIMKKWYVILNRMSITALSSQQIEFLNNLDSFIYSYFEISDENGNILNLQKNDDYNIAG